ncbi:hypothetical protein RHGRI_004307 [Rhododendron griersonianum]|uniref:Uncharacterized protein n=1 Tax=Rhododendron griersonianum TaxID=479676 RepID=A0AAV6L863_9ERIC|nr:hypothetical protein RHGRI_004307 [Rhododendron griersonianum]
METQPTIYMVSRATPCYLNSNSFLQKNKSTSSSLYLYLSLDKICVFMLQSGLLHQNPCFLEPESNNGSDPTFESTDSTGYFSCLKSSGTSLSQLF